MKKPPKPRSKKPPNRKAPPLPPHAEGEGRGGRGAKGKAPANKKKPARSRVPSPAHLARALRVYDTLAATYPDAHCELDHHNAFELLAATILSAQCTDARVNMVTPALFAKYPNPAAMAEAPLDDLETLVKTTGFYRNKAKSLKGMAAAIVERHAGEVPRTMEELVELPGAARKTANVVLGNAFNTNVGVVVDTHVGRLSQRLAFTTHDDPKRIEVDLMARFPQDRWAMLAHLLIFHGRRICKARGPACEVCPVVNDCPKLGVTKTAAGNPPPEPRKVP